MKTCETMEEVFLSTSASTIPDVSVQISEQPIIGHWIILPTFIDQACEGAQSQEPRANSYPEYPPPKYSLLDNSSGQPGVGTGAHYRDLPPAYFSPVGALEDFQERLERKTAEIGKSVQLSIDKCVFIYSVYRVSQKKCLLSPFLSFRPWEGCF